MGYDSIHPETPTGWRVRSRHDCETCGEPARFELRRDPHHPQPTDEPERELGWGWSSRRTPSGGLLIFGRRHVPNRHYYGSGDGCVYVAPLFEGTPSLVDQLRAQLSGGWENERERVADFDPALLMGTPLIARAHDAVGNAPAIGLIARAPHMRYYLRNGAMPTNDEQIADLRWTHDTADTRRFEALIGARLEPIRG